MSRNLDEADAEVIYRNLARGVKGRRECQLFDNSYAGTRQRRSSSARRHMPYRCLPSTKRGWKPLGALASWWHFSGLRDRRSNIPRFVRG
jgi:hypothetical protein